MTVMKNGDDGGGNNNDDDCDGDNGDNDWCW